MRKKEESKGLNNWEIKILKALQSNPKKFDDLHNAENIHRNILTDCLKNLQKLGLVTRDIETRMYYAENISVLQMFYYDILDFMQNQTAQDLKTQDKEKKSIINSFFWLATTDCAYPEFAKKLKKTLEDQENAKVLNKVNKMIKDTWESYVLSLSPRKKSEQQIILKYKQFLLETNRLLTKNQELKTDKNLNALLLALAREGLKSEFPEFTNISEDAVYIEATRELRQAEKDKELNDPPWDLDDLFFRLELKEKCGDIQDSEDAEKEKRLFEIADFLKDKKNRKIYEGYLKSIGNEPKTLLVFPFLGFWGYLEKLKVLFPEKAVEVGKKMQNEQEQALQDIIKDKIEKFKRL